MPCSLQDISDGLVRDVVAEICQCAGNAIVTPTGVLLCHLHDEPFDRGIHARASRIATTLGAVEFAGDQAAIPRQDGLRFGNAGHLLQMLPTEAFADFSESTALRVGEPDSS